MIWGAEKIEKNNFQKASREKQIFKKAFQSKKKILKRLQRGKKNSRPIFSPPPPQIINGRALILTIE